MFSIGTAGLTAWGRIRFGAEVGLEPGAIVPIQLRYYSFTAPLWASALVLSAFSLQNNVTERANGLMPILDAVAFIVSCLVCIAIYLTSPSAVQLIDHIKQPAERDAAAIVSSAPDQQAMKHVYPFPDINVTSLVPYLVDKHLSIFHAEADRILYARAHNALQKPIFTGGAVGTRCGAEIEEIKVERVNDSQPSWYQIRGSILHSAAEASAYGILLADGQARLVGVGRLTQVNKSGKEQQWHRSTFIGYAETGSPASVVAYLLERSAVEPCRLDRMPAPQ